MSGLINIDELRSWVSLAKQTNTIASYAAALDVAMQFAEAASADANRYNKMIENGISVSRCTYEPTKTPAQVKIELDKFIDES